MLSTYVAWKPVFFLIRHSWHRIFNDNSINASSPCQYLPCRIGASGHSILASVNSFEKRKRPLIPSMSIIESFILKIKLKAFVARRVLCKSKLSTIDFVII
ncbi:hypothetical protein LMG33818_000754 [Halomonadaceae bacterium LMG 33818]